MSKKHKIYLAVLAVVVILFLVTKLNDKTERKISFFEVDSAKIECIEITTIEDTLRLVKKDNSWFMEYPIECPASPNKIERFFEKVLSIKTSNLPISEQESSFETYNLTDSLSTIIKLYGKDDKLLDVSMIGKSSSYSNTPARKQGKNKIYRLEENIAYDIKTESSNWRKREVLELEKEQIAKISVIYENIGYELTATDTLWQFEDGENSVSIQHDNPALRTILNSLSKVNVSQFIDEDIENYLIKLQNPTLEIGINLYDESKYYLRAALSDDNKYVLQVNNETEHLYTINENWLKKFRKQAEDFRK